MDKALVSIIIPVFNAEKYLSESIESAIAQSWSHKEIIIIDDGSTDNSLNIAKLYQCNWIKVLHQENKGASAARNRGLSEAKGEYIQFLDADDILSPDKIMSQLEVIDGHKNYLGLCGTAYFNDGDDPLNTSVISEWFSAGSDDPVDFLIKLYSGHEIMKGYGGMIQPNAMLTPMSVINKAGFWNEELTVDDDGEFFCRVVLASDGIRYSSKGINYYRNNNGRTSLSSGRSKNDFESIKSAIDLKMYHLKVYADDEIIDKIFASHYWWPGVHSYPRFKDLSAYFIRKAKDLNYTGQKYKAGPLSNIFAKMLGWRTIRLISYMKHGF